MTDTKRPEVLENVLTDGMQGLLRNRLAMLRHSGALTPDRQVPGSLIASADPVFETFMLTVQPRIESLVGQNLYPTYSFGRLYKRGTELRRHIDRPACEFSVSVPVWSERPELDAIFFEDPNSGSTYQFNLRLGDMLFYQGCSFPHWRNPASSDYFNVFLHYVDASGPNAEWRYDKRQYLTI